MRERLAAAFAALALCIAGSASAYENFRVAIYCRAQEVQKMADPKWLEDSWNAISREVHVDRIYIETHRDRILVDGAPLPAAEAPRLWRYHKPRGVVTTHADPQGRPTVFAALPQHLHFLEEAERARRRDVFDEALLRNPHRPRLMTEQRMVEADAIGDLEVVRRIQGDPLISLGQ